MWSYGFSCFLFIIQITSARIVPNGFPNVLPGGFSRGLPTFESMPNGIPINNQMLLATSVSDLNKVNVDSTNTLLLNTYLPNNNIITNAKKADVNLGDSYDNRLLITNNNDLSKSIAIENLPMSNLVPKADVFTILKSSDDRTLTPASNNDIINRIANGWKPKTITLNIGDPYTTRSGKNDNSKIFLEIMIDSVDIHGTVSVSGSMPIYGAVTMTGNVPSTGKASVNYSSAFVK